MKLLRVFVSLTIIIFCLAVSAESVNARELPASGRNFLQKEIIPASQTVNIKHPVDKMQAAIGSFNIVDSLVNAYSYFTNDQQPFVYYAPTNTLITIKRGALAASAGQNTLNDLYVRTSKDWGVTWNPAELIYTVDKGNMARYPSVYGFEFESQMAYVFTAPANQANGWQGFINGIFTAGNSAYSFTYNETLNGKAYGWTGTDSKIFGAINGSDAYAIATGSIMPPSGLPLVDNSSIGKRTSTSFVDWTSEIPAAWASSNFVTPIPDATYTDSLSNSSVIGLKMEETDKILYSAVYGRFTAADVTTASIPGVSKSTDLGKTWSDFEIFPRSVLNNYLTGLSIDPTEVFIINRDFVPFAGGDYSFVVSLYEDTSKSLIPFASALHQIVELYKENGQFGLRPIANTTGFSLKYNGAAANNQMGDELMVTRTVDGSALLVKWVDFVNAVNTNGDTVYNYTTDILASIRLKDSKKWSDPRDISESEIFDRITWIPNYIPNDLKSVPVLKIESIPNSLDTPEEASLRQRTLESTPVATPQYVMVGHFDANLLLGVEQEEKGSAFSLPGVYPNPASTEIYVDAMLPSSGNVKVQLCDMFGRNVVAPFANVVGAGSNTFRFDVSNVVSGAYFVKVEYNGNSETRLINIVK